MALLIKKTFSSLSVYRETVCQISAIQTFEEVVTVLNGSTTMLIVTHGHYTAKHCDRLYRLRRFRVLAEGLLAATLPTKRAASSS